ncbi:unnamed protein product, partial [Ectocarpus fasciculatus]
CPICLGACVKQSDLNNCAHKFCLECIQSWTKINTSCPICKANVTAIISGGVSYPVITIQRTSDNDESDYSSEASAEDIIVGEENYGYEYDDFVVDDEFVEFESEDD